MNLGKDITWLIALAGRVALGLLLAALVVLEAVGRMPPEVAAACRAALAPALRLFGS